MTAGLKWPPEMCPTAYAIVTNGEPEGQCDAEEPDAERVARVFAREVRREDGRAAASEDQHERAEELGAETLRRCRDVLTHR